MPLFAKNKPTQKVEFEGGYVELQYLSKGVKDEISRRSTEINKDLPQEVVNKLRNNPNAEDKDIPVEIFGTVGKLMEIEYYKLSHAIRSWSDSDTPITEDSVKDMDDEIFDLVSKKVDEMNALKQSEQKN